QVLIYVLNRPPPSSKLFPYTTLFRSERAIRELLSDPARLAEMSKTGRDRVLASYSWKGEGARLVEFCNRLGAKPADRAARNGARSEEHTSELQSLAYLVCRLLLEKKK